MHPPFALEILAIGCALISISCSSLELRGWIYSLNCLIPQKNVLLQAFSPNLRLRLWNPLPTGDSAVCKCIANVHTEISVISATRLFLSLQLMEQCMIVIIFDIQIVSLSTVNTEFICVKERYSFLKGKEKRRWFRSTLVWGSVHKYSITCNCRTTNYMTYDTAYCWLYRKIMAHEIILSSTSGLPYCLGSLVMTDTWICRNTKSKALVVWLSFMINGISSIQGLHLGLSSFASYLHWAWWIRPGDLGLMVKAVAQACAGAPPAPRSLRRRLPASSFINLPPRSSTSQ